MSAAEVLSERQRREIEFHRDFARKHADKADMPVKLDPATSEKRRWWNAYWHTYTKLRATDLKGKRAIVIGCGFGDDAIRLSLLGTEVEAIDISPEVIDVARARAAKMKADTRFHVMPAERLAFDDDSFDAAFFVDILHHVDIALAVKEMRRVLRLGALVIGDELYTHSWMQRVRKTWLVNEVLYPRMLRYIYRGGTPYITADEHKIDEGEFAVIQRAFRGQGQVDYFGVAEGRLFPTIGRQWLLKLDRSFMRCIGPAGRYLASRVVFSGEISK